MSFSVKKESDAHGFHGLQRYCTSQILPKGQTVNKEYYLGVMRRLREANKFAKKERICGQTTRGFCTMITHRRVVPSLSVNF